MTKMQKIIRPAVKIDEARSFAPVINMGFVAPVKSGGFRVTVTTDDGFQEILSCQFEVSTEQDGVDYLLANGFEQAA